MAILKNNTTIADLNAYGYPNNFSGSYLYGLGYTSLNATCKNGNVRGIFIGSCSGTRINCANDVVAIGSRVIGRASASGKTGICQSVFIGSYSMSEFDCDQSFTNSVGVGFEVFKCSQDSPSFNVAIGFRSMYNILQPSKNVMVGSYTGRNLVSTCNVVLGTRAGEDLENGFQNLFIGFKAGQYMRNSFRNVIIGYCAGNVGYHVGIIAIGSNAYTSGYANYHTSFGNSSTSSNRVGASGWTIASDRYDKTDIVDLPDDLGLNFIRKLKPVKFKLDPRDRYIKKCGFEWGQRDHTLKNEKESYGFLAQDIEMSINELGSRFDAVSHNEFEDTYRINTTDLISPVIKSLKQTLDRLEIIENKLNQD
jgi:hypothetical protein